MRVERPNEFGPDCSFRTNGANVGRAVKRTRKVSVLSLPETIKQNSTIRGEGPKIVGKLLFQVMKGSVTLAVIFTT